MIDAWKSELRRIAGLVLVAVLFGASLGNIAVAVLLVLGAYLVWHLYNLQRLVRWLREGKKLRPPQASGIWNDVFERILALQERNRKRKRGGQPGRQKCSRPLAPSSTGPPSAASST